MHAGFEMDKIHERNIIILHKDLNQNCYLGPTYYDMLALWPYLMLQLTWPKFCCSFLLQKMEIWALLLQKIKKK